MFPQHHTSAARTLAGSDATRPVCVYVDVDGVDVLEGVQVDQTRLTTKEASQALHGCPAALSRSAHPAANFLGRKLAVDSVTRKVVGPGCRTPVGRV